MAQDFIPSLSAMDLSQIVTNWTHERGHTFNLIFCTGRLREVLFHNWKFILNYGVMIFYWRQEWIWYHPKAGPVKVVYPWRFMDCRNVSNGWNKLSLDKMEVILNGKAKILRDIVLPAWMGFSWPSLMWLEPRGYTGSSIADGQAS